MVFVIITAIVLYFIPSFLGYDKKNSTSIFVLNLFLGWTLIGWVVSLVWAVSHEKNDEPVIETPKAPKTTSVIDELEKLDSLRNKGVITQEEFEIQKNKILG